MSQLIDDALAGRRRAIARLITQIESSPEQRREVISRIYSHTGRAHIVGVTGPPGSGKSTLVNKIALALRESGRSVGIVAVDPSSPFSGGAVLGDRVRMRDLSGDKGLFIRSMASRGSLGGLSAATGATVHVLDAAGFDVVLIETVGVGQAEVDIAAMAHTTLVVEAPGMGDAVQSIKAGILEIADILVVNKADLAGSDRTVRVLNSMLELGPTTSSYSRRFADGGSSGTPGADDSYDWQVTVLETTATDGDGIIALVESIDAHLAKLKDSTEWHLRVLQRSRIEVIGLVQDRILESLRESVPDHFRESLIEEVAARQTDPYCAVSILLREAFNESESVIQ